MPSMASKAPLAAFRPATLALSLQEAEAMGSAAAAAGTTLAGLKDDVVARGFKRDGVTMLRVLAAFHAEKAAPKSPYPLTGGLPMRLPNPGA